MPWVHGGAAGRAGFAARQHHPQWCAKRHSCRCVPLSCSRGACVSFGCLPFGELLKKARISGGNGAVDFEASVGPVPDPIAVVEIGMAGIAITDERFMMASAGAQRARPTGRAIVLGIDVAAAQEISLLLAIDAG